MTEASNNLPLFRVHFHDGTSVDVRAGNSLIAEKDARKKRPGDFVKKIKLVRDQSLSSSVANAAIITKDIGHD